MVLAEQLRQEDIGVVTHLQIVKKEGYTFKVYNYFGDHKWTDVQVSVFAQKGKYWRDTKGRDTGNYFWPENNLVNMFPTTIEILDLDGKQILLVSPAQGNFPQDSQIVLDLKFSPSEGYIDRVFTNSTIRQPTKAYY